MARRHTALILGVVVLGCVIGFWARVKDGDVAGAARGVPLRVMGAPRRGAKPDVWVVGVLGQSNAVGHGELAELPAGFSAHGRQIWTYKGRLEPAREPVGGKGVGFALAFAERIAARHPGVTVVLVPCAKDSTGIAEWDPAGMLYYGAALRIREACRDSGGACKAVLWDQGEADEGSQETAGEWAGRFKAIVEHLKGDMHSEVILFTQCGDVGAGLLREHPEWFAWRALLLQRQASCAGIPGCVMIPARGLGLKADGIHRTTAGQLELGREYAAAFEKFETGAESSN